ncbi:MAG TPA: HAMP domain-containing sensor histidine kinase [Myxococcaceae bacterium]|nr:HAMP domain-containing sensor histidine kinase [Myxococcaceae bacterium]
MVSSTVPQPLPSAPTPPEPGSPRPRALPLLDMLLSEKQRQASPLDLVRYRVLMGATAFLLMFALLALVVVPQLASKLIMACTIMGYLGTMVLARRTSTPTPPSLLLCINICLALVGFTATIEGVPYISTYSAHMMVPALAVYLMGPRLGLVITLVLVVAQGIVQPFYQASRVSGLDVNFWPLHGLNCICFLTAWVLGWLHSNARDSVQASLERTLGALRQSVTAYQEAELRLSGMHRTLVDVSRQAGMAEIATGVLHNVSNTLNSVTISTGLVIDQLRASRVAGLSRAVELLREHSADMASFLSTDPRGQKLPGYLFALANELQQEREAMLQEMQALSNSVDHIKSVVTMQQKHARVAGTLESLHLPQLIDEALRLNAVSFERQGIRIERQYENAPPVIVDRHKLLQILINLLSNARHALAESDREDKQLIIRVRTTQGGERLLLEVADNGKGIAPENLPRLFTQGFTTKRTGHGFGLHISALSAEEMKGQLTCASAGPGQGATFTLELPMRGPEAEA